VTSLTTPKDFRAARYLPFCYLCGEVFNADDDVDGDHVPPKSAFNPRDREPPLKLKTHKKCNAGLSVDDRKVGQLIALRRGERPRSARDHALKIVRYGDAAAVENLNVDAAVWRWVRGFHAALYHEPLMATNWSLRTPFPRADMRGSTFVLQPLLPQHAVIVEAIKRNRALENLDRIVANRGRLRFASVWCPADRGAGWLCFFALDIYDWKDLGSHTKDIPSRGCAGMYVLPDRSMPSRASTDRGGVILVPNSEALDPFGR
jgi:hypothetical protein